MTSYLSCCSQHIAVSDIFAALVTKLTVLDVVRDFAQDRSQEARLRYLQALVEPGLTIRKEMGGMLRHFATHSQDGENSTRDWLKTQYGEKTLEERSKRFYSGKSTVTVAFDAIKV